jgi:hypothetical protein
MISAITSTIRINRYNLYRLNTTHLQLGFYEGHGIPQCQIALQAFTCIDMYFRDGGPTEISVRFTSLQDWKLWRSIT